jgi:hypothetical protein
MTDKWTGPGYSSIQLKDTHIAQAGHDLESHVDETKDSYRNIHVPSDVDARRKQHEDKDRYRDDHRRQIRGAQPRGVQQREESSKASQNLRDNARLSV